MCEVSVWGWMVSWVSVWGECEWGEWVGWVGDKCVCGVSVWGGG